MLSASKLYHILSLPAEKCSTVECHTNTLFGMVGAVLLSLFIAGFVATYIFIPKGTKYSTVWHKIGGTLAALIPLLLGTYMVYLGWYQ